MKQSLILILITICNVFFSQTIYGGAANIDSALVAYYPFNGNANDKSGSGNDGVVYGAILTTDRFGNENSALYFDGVNNYININCSESLESVVYEQTIPNYQDDIQYYKIKADDF